MRAVSILGGAMLSPKLHIMTENVTKRIMNVYLYSVMWAEGKVMEESHGDKGTELNLH